MKKLALMVMFALSLLATGALADNPTPDCSTGQCNWIR
jgi:hypothetical protein